MNSRPAATNVPPPDDRPEFGVERPVSVLDGETQTGRSTLLLRRAAVPLMLLFYGTQFSTMTLTRFMRVPEESADVILPRLIVTAGGILFCVLNLRIQRSIGRAGLRKRVLVAAGLAVAGAYYHATVNLVVFGLLFGLDPFRVTLLDFALSGYDWLWFYSAVSVMLLALTYAADLAESEERIAALQRQAHAAQLKALRYQLNPHFLFNTLNAIAALIGKKQSADAEAMVVSLSDFLRSTLTMEAGGEITLGEEIELQALYLDIEKARFPARLSVSIEIPESLRSALVPNLITQPLIENAIKYGVARSASPVHLRIGAVEARNMLSLTIDDDGGDVDELAPAASGTGVGLRNVSERLWQHYGDAARLTAGPRSAGGFSAEIQMPLKRG